MATSRRIAMLLCVISYLLTYAFAIAALLTEYWVEADHLEKHGIISKHSRMNAGLFQGTRTLDSPLGQQRQRFSLLAEIQEGTSYMTKTSWLFVMFFIALGLVWTSVGLIVALLSTTLPETRSVTGPAGLYLWSSLAVASITVAVAIFLSQFYRFMSDSVLLPEHQQAGFSSKGLLSLGYSFWFLIYGLATLLLPCVFTFITTEKLDESSSKQPLADKSIFLY